MPSQAEIEAIFKLKNDPSNKRVLDNFKGDLERALGSFSMKGSKGALTPKMLSMMSPADRASLQKQGEQAGQAFAKGFRRYGMADLPKMWGGSQSPITPAWMTKGFFRGGSAKRSTNWGQAAMGGATALFNPWIGSRMLSDAFGGGGKGGKGGGTAAGIFGAGGAMGFAEFYLAIQVFKTAINMFNKTVQTAFSNYTGAAKQGVSTSFFVGRSNTAKSLGLNPASNEVFQFGAAAKYVADRTREANQALSQNAKPLATVAIDFNILKTNLAALASEITLQVAPAVDAFINKMSELASYLMKHADVVSAVLQSFTGVLGMGVSMYNSNHPNGKENLANKLPNMIGSMKQLPASAWEHMGLVVGGGGMNYNKIIADNSKKQVNLLAIIAKALKGEHMQSLGFNPMVANP